MVAKLHMPIRLPKGFQRRKSSGNVLEELQNLPEGSSFRVIHARDGDSFDSGPNFAKGWDGELAKQAYPNGEEIENRDAASRRPSSQPMQR